MTKIYKIYLDVCCLNRLYDEQTQRRIRLETEAVIMILSQCQLRIWKLITSDILDAEIRQTPDLVRLKKVEKLLSIAKIKVIANILIKNRAANLTELGFSSYDAAHLASAERAEADIFLTTDDRLLKKAQNFAPEINVKVDNPVQWLVNVLQKEDSNDFHTK